MEVDHSSNIQLVFREWAARFASVYDKQYDPTHACVNEDCCVVQVVGSVYRSAGGGNVVRFKDDEINATDTFICEYNRIYVCVVCMVPHWCCGACEHQMRDDYGYVCKLSGLRSEVGVTDTWIPQYRISATSSECKDPKSLGEHIIKSSSGRNIVQSRKHIDYAADVVYSLMFSTTRCYAEQRKYAEQRLEAERNVAQYMKERECQNLPCIYTDILHIYIDTMKARRIFFALVPKCADAKHLSMLYAKRVCAFWRTICNCTPLGQHSPNSFAFVTFVTPALFLMRRGLWIRGHEIIRKDPFLNTLLPDANTLDLYSVSKTLFTQTKNNILKAFREAVDEYNIHPEKLKNDAINTIIFPKIAQKK